MGNIIKSFLDLSGDVASTQVADVYLPLVDIESVGASKVAYSPSNLAVDELIYLIESAVETSNSDELDAIYRTKETFFKYVSSSNNASGFLLPQGSKVVKIGEQDDWALVVVWKDGTYYKGIVPKTSLLTLAKSQNIVNVKSFINDAEHTLFRFKKRLNADNALSSPFAQRILPSLTQNLNTFKQLFSNNPQEAENRLKSALIKYKPLMAIPPSQVSYVDIVQRQLDAIFSVNDFTVDGLPYSKQVLVLPFTESWVLKYKDQGFDEDEELQEIVGKFYGISGEGSAVGYEDWERTLRFLDYLADIVNTNEAARNTQEGQWLLNYAMPLIDAGQIKEIIFIQESTWQYSIEEPLASDIGLRDMHGPFYTPPLFTVIAHEINVNPFNTDFEFISTDTHITEYNRNYVKANYMDILKLSNNIDYIDALYLSNSYLNALNLTYTLNSILS